MEVFLKSINVVIYLVIYELDYKRMDNIYNNCILIKLNKMLSVLIRILFLNVKKKKNRII